MPVVVASQWVVATTPNVPTISGRDVTMGRRMIRPVATSGRIGHGHGPRPRAPRQRGRDRGHQQPDDGAVRTDVSWNAPSTLAGAAPARITTTAATPSVAPMLRSAWLVPAPAANRAGARPCTAALDSWGRVSATPRPISR